MPKPKGKLTAAQYEIMAVVWATGTAGVTVADIWQTIAKVRSVARTTVLNQVDRLERRGWLRRLTGDGPTRFAATLSREDAAHQLVTDFVADFFQGSTSELVSALLGSDASSLTRKDVDRLRQLLDQARRQPEGDRP
jgi:predicted transcriptional regulator